MLTTNIDPVIYAEYSSLQSNLPDWMLQKYLKPEASNIQCWAEQTKQVVDGPQWTADGLSDH